MSNARFSSKGHLIRAILLEYLISGKIVTPKFVNAQVSKVIKSAADGIVTFDLSGAKKASGITIQKLVLILIS
jgi:hypothetical protein